MPDTTAPNPTPPRPTGEQPPVDPLRSESAIRRWAPWITIGVLLLGLIWSNFVEPRLAQSFVTAQRGTKIESAARTNEERLNKHALRIQRVEDSIVATKGILEDIRDGLQMQYTRRRK